MNAIEIIAKGRVGLVATANKLLQIQELMHRIHGDRYEERAAPWKRIIAAKAKHDGTSETAAAIALAKDAPSGPQSLLILSSAVEMKSPNKECSQPATQ